MFGAPPSLIRKLSARIAACALTTHRQPTPQHSHTQTAAFAPAIVNRRQMRVVRACVLACVPARTQMMKTAAATTANVKPVCLSARLQIPARIRFAPIAGRLPLKMHINLRPLRLRSSCVCVSVCLCLRRNDSTKPHDRNKILLCKTTATTMTSTPPIRTSFWSSACAVRVLL